MVSEWVKRYGLGDANSIGLSGWADDREWYYFHSELVHINPFSPAVMGGACSGEERSEGDVVQDHLLGRDCEMDVGEWHLFCREVLLLEVPIAQTLDAVVGMVDEMVVFMVQAAVGRGGFGAAGGSARLMELVVVLVRFMILCGGSGVLPFDYAVARFGGVNPLSVGGPVASVRGRAFALKVMRRLNSLGRCVRGLLRVAWDSAEWVDPGLMGALGLGSGRAWYLHDVWRAALGVDTALAVFMRNVVGPAYLPASSSDEGHVVHEYAVTAWRRHVEYTPMSSETLVGGVVSHLVCQSGRYSDVGGVDRQCQVFLHNLHWGFMNESKYVSLRGSSRFSVDLLAVFGIVVGWRADGVRQLEFWVGEHVGWRLGGSRVHSKKHGERVVDRFLSPLSSGAASDVEMGDPVLSRGVGDDDGSVSLMAVVSGETE